MIPRISPLLTVLFLNESSRPSDCLSCTSYTGFTSSWIPQSKWLSRSRDSKDASFRLDFSLTEAPRTKHRNRSPTLAASHKNQLENEPPENLESASLNQFSSKSPNVRNILNPEDNDKLDQRLQGLLVLLTVPMAWGTYAPAVKYVYQLQPPLPGLVFSAAYYAVASVTLLVLLSIQQNVGDGDKESSLRQFEQNDKTPIQSSVIPVQVQGGLELGSYLVLGNTLQVIGLQSVPADRAAFLVQLTTIMVPLLEALFARNFRSLSTKTWLACIIAFAGVMSMELDGRTAGLTAMPSMETGDELIALSAVAYSFHVLRLEKYAKEVKPLTLAASKATFEAVASALLVLGLFWIDPTSNALGKEILDFYEAAFDGSILLSSQQILQLVGAVLWTGIVTCAYTIYAQSFGQRRVKPTDANLIYSSQPIFSAIFAFWLLGETLGSLGLIGGALIASAMYLVSSSVDGVEQQQDITES